MFLDALPELRGIELPSLDERVIGRYPLKWSAERPDAPAVVFLAEQAKWTYREFASDATAVAAGLRDLGLVPGDRLGIMLPNRSEYLLAWFGSSFNGLIDVAINHGLTKAMLLYQLTVARVRAVVCDAESYESLLEVAEDVPSLEVLITTEPVARQPRRLRVTPFASLSGSTLGFDYALSSPTDITSIRYTSGTTGPAKAVACTNSQKAVGGSLFIQLMGYQPDDRLYTCFPLHHSLASMMGVASTFQTGGCVVVDDRFSASRYWQRVQMAEATLGHILDPMVPMLMSQPASQADQGHQCRELWTAFNHPDFEERFNVKLHQHYSMTEMAPIAYRQRNEESVPDGSCGKVGELFDLRVVDEDEYPVRPGEHGEVLVRPNYPHITMAGYFGNDAATAAAWRGLWYHTGDEGYVDSSGYLYLVGRMGDQIRRRGVNIPAEHIEDAARSHSAVIDAAAIAIPSSVGESEIKLALVTAHPDAPPSVEDFLSHLMERLPREMVPRFIEWRADLPRTGTQKVNKSEMRKEGRNGITTSTMDLTDRLAPAARTSSSSETSDV